jgi:hypothetical protein
MNDKWVELNRYEVSRQVRRAAPPKTEGTPSDQIFNTAARMIEMPILSPIG